MNLLTGTGVQRAAKTSRVQVGQPAQNLAFASWEVNESVAELLTTNFESYVVANDQTFEEGIKGVSTCAFRFGGSWDANARPFLTAPGLYPRDDLGTVNLINTRTEGTAWGFTYARIRGVTNSGAVDGLVLFNVTDAKNQGAFTRPQ